MRCLTRWSPVVVLLFVFGCMSADPQRTPQREHVPPLSHVPAGTASAADIANAYSTLAAGILTRTRFATETGRNHNVEVRDLIVAPNKRSAETELPGAAILLVRQGRGTVHGVADGNLVPGRTLSIPEGTRFSIESSTEKHLIIRAYVVIPETVGP